MSATKFGNPRFFRLANFLAICASVFFVCVTAMAQSASKYKKGDEIQVFFLGGWKDAVVVDTNRTQVLAEFEFAAATKQQAFKADQVRYKFEEDALGRARFWSDQSGKFRIRAALIRIDETMVTLRKEDLAEVKVPIVKLSEGDQAFLKRLEEAKKMKYHIAQESFFAPLPTLSGGRRYLFVPEDKQVRVFDAVSGRIVSTLPAEDGAAGVAVTEDGQQAAVLSRTSLTVWDLTSTSAEPAVYQAEAIGTPFAAKLSWVGERRVMVDSGPFGQVLFSLDLKLPLWNYQFDHAAVRESGGRRLREIVDSHLVYAASLSSGRERGLAVGAVRLPGPQVDEAAASLDRETLNIMKPGSSVSLEVQCGQHDAQVRAALEKQIADNQWVLSPSAPAKLLAEMGRGETQTVTYRMSGGRGDQSATVTPFYSRLKLEVGNKLAWQSGTSTGAPPIIQLQEGESAQSKIDQWQNPNPGFFATVDVPDSILDPDMRKGLGSTNVTTRGLVPAQ